MLGGEGTARVRRSGERTMRSSAAAWLSVVRAQRGGVGCSAADARHGLLSAQGSTRGIHRAIDAAYNSLARLNGSFFAQGACGRRFLPPNAKPPPADCLATARFSLEGGPTPRGLDGA